MTLRIVSLLPSATEIVAGLGYAGALVGRSHECDFPEEVRRLPVCTAPRAGLSAGDGGEIHRRLARLLADGLTVYRVDPDRLRALRPTHVVTQLQCAVCAATPEDVARALAAWEEPPAVVSLSGGDLAGVYRDFETTAAALGDPAAGEALAGRVAARVGGIEAAARGLLRPRVAVLEWLDPLLGAGNWVPELVAKAGGEPLFGTPGGHSRRLEPAELAAADPDVILAAPCGYPLSRTAREARLLTHRPGWRDLAAVRAGRVFLADGNRYFNRPGPGLAETLEILAEVLHPEVFEFGHEGTGWLRAEPDEARREPL